MRKDQAQRNRTANICATRTFLPPSTGALATSRACLYDIRVRIVLILCAAAALFLAACGDDDDSDTATPTASVSEEPSATGDGATETGTPGPSVTTGVLDEDGEPNAAHPLIQAIAANYLSQLPPVSFTDPISCEGINAEWEEADADERDEIDQENIGRVCIVLAQSVFGDETAEVAVGPYRSEISEVFDLELRGGAWVIVATRTQAPS